MNRLAILAIPLLTLAAEPGQILGTWLTPNGKSKIEITKCGEAYCGSITWMQTPKNDDHNEDPKLRNRPLVGTQILTGFRSEKGNSWTGGKVYGPERGKTANAKLTLLDPDTLEVRASAGIASKSIVWTRAK